MLDTGTDLNKVKFMFLALQKPMSILTREHDILVRDLEHFALLHVMVRNHCEGSPLMEPVIVHS